MTVSSFDPANNWFWEAIADKVLELTGLGQTMWRGELAYMSEYDARPRPTPARPSPSESWRRCAA